MENISLRRHKTDIVKRTDFWMPSELTEKVGKHSTYKKIAIEKLGHQQSQDIFKDDWSFKQLKDCIFIGHTVPDTDAVCSAIGGAALYGGVATIAELPINPETKFALEYFKIECPPLFDDYYQGENAKRNICLTDHNSKSQMNEKIPHDKIRGIIDHHPLKNDTVTTPGAIMLDIRPWGSAATIIAHTFIKKEIKIEKGVAGVMLCALLSDTLNLKSPTSTKNDEQIAAVLQELAGVEDIDELAEGLFKAKASMLNFMTPYEIIHGDFKRLNINGTKIGFGVSETTDEEALVKRSQELILELQATKKQEGYDLLFYAIVDVLKLRSTLIIGGPVEQQLAEKIYGGKALNGVLDMGNRVSRKKEYVPPIEDAFMKGWKMPEELIEEARNSLAGLDISDIVMEADENNSSNIKILRHVSQSHI